MEQMQNRRSAEKKSLRAHKAMADLGPEGHVGRLCVTMHKYSSYDRTNKIALWRTDYHSL